ncbi:hypothetical protein SAMN02745784_00623 [Tissierella praeacuta DSM 18095]|uniref:Uncharacterized protein n=1 Tax=Tissierella praeacuta DSM 18095 TaxID=1123404 RepID=A0A1M4TDC0_9FIRM|nr:DUF6320 domain-containing protein [Tissierella praeacuta]TCU68116.1 hypothetical protein EV204_11022 [Tissierella praeacuta]SHE42471.1 hypothetical protein SAMN02745784_00623 [Tissierella praeacuta DSM 18095]SUP04726.1 Uncharacterised protein [Tissierella praeacuta]HAE91560.1 hypothetical protein [Tissierella sp.]
MKYCAHCNVHIRENREKCILCGNSLTDIHNTAKDKEIFPKIPPFYESHLAIKIMIFISIAAVVISFAINIIFPSNVNWPLLLVFGLLSMWLGLISILQRRYHIPKKIVRQVAIISLLSVFWDWKTGWKGWSLDYIIPITSATAMIVMYVIAKIMKLSVRDYITYALIDSLFGIVPIIFVLLGWINTIYPAIICVSISIISLSAVFIFHGNDIKIEMDKRMHI